MGITVAELDLPTPGRDSVRVEIPATAAVLAVTNPLRGFLVQGRGRVRGRAATDG